MSSPHSLVLTCTAPAFLTFFVAARMYWMRVREMKTARIQPQAVALSAEKNAPLNDTRASDNDNHPFELPVLLYALSAIALAVGHVPVWLAR